MLLLMVIYWQFLLISARISLNVPDGLLDEFGDTWQSDGLDSRSRGVREATQEYIETHTRLEDIEFVRKVGRCEAAGSWDERRHCRHAGCAFEEPPSGRSPLCRSSL